MLKRLREIVSVSLASNATTTVVTATPTGLTFNINPKEIWFVDCQITAECLGIGGSKYEVSAPTGATVEGWIYSSLAAITTPSYQRITAINTLNATALHTVATTPAPDIIRFTITNPTTAGAVTIEIASVTAGQTTTLILGSGMLATRIS